MLSTAVLGQVFTSPHDQGENRNCRRCPILDADVQKWTGLLATARTMLPEAYPAYLAWTGGFADRSVRPAMKQHALNPMGDLRQPPLKRSGSALYGI
jgi:hypothetical protein